MTSPQPERAFVYAADLTHEDVRALETFIDTQLGRTWETEGGPSAGP
ncbi:hypothetical protein [Streptomyces barkulensis]|nr:hypothetical protein [Streptomyces barkulensis]